MNKDNAIAYLPLVIALVNGEIIELKSFNNEWRVISDLQFNEVPERYRIKPKVINKWCRVAKLISGCYLVETMEAEAYTEHSRYFVEWLTDRIEYTIG